MRIRKFNSHAVADGASSPRPLPGTDARDSQVLNSDNSSNNISLPAYSSGIELHEQSLDARAAFTGDGRVDIDIDQKNGRFSENLTSALAGSCPGDELPPYGILKETDVIVPPSMSIVIQVVGSRSEVQRFLALGKVLKEKHGHRVRLATHAKFGQFVSETGIDFFSIGGDPDELVEYMVGNPGLLPSVDGLWNGSVVRKQEFIAEILEGCWRSCIEPGKDGLPFVADAIIANPSSFSHIHCAEKLGIPLHLTSTMPWTSTQAFPHPYAHVQSTSVKPNLGNYLSFHLIEVLMWQGLVNVINRFRTKTLELEPISPLFAPGLLGRLKIPFTYCWSPALFPRPSDWGSHISISGLFDDFTNTTYVAPIKLSQFLENGPAPVYVGFGSIPLGDPAAATNLILEAVASVGVRAIISRGPTGLGDALDNGKIPDNVYFADEIPHSWLFPRCAAVVHHGGASTTKTGLVLGKPTVAVPFSGSQFFWGDMIFREGAGSKPVPFCTLTSRRLAEAIAFALEWKVAVVARNLMEAISKENGVETGVAHFHAALGAERGSVQSCAIHPRRVAVYKLKGKYRKGEGPAREHIYLSALAAAVLVREDVIDWHNLELFRHREYNTAVASAPLDPFSSLMANTFGTMSQVMSGLADGPLEGYRQIGKAQAGISDKRHKAQNGSPQSDSRQLSGEGANPSSGNGSIPTSSSITLPANPYGAVLMSSGRGLVRVAGAGLKTPATFIHGLTRGFHNMPLLYGDETVRKEEKIDGLSSGLAAAGKGLGYGLYDGLTGIITQPLAGAKKEGAVGVLKGFGKGIGGVICKPASGACGVPSNAFMGVYKSLQKLRAGKTSLADYILTARIEQGEAEALALAETERRDVLRKWDALMEL